MSEIEKEEILGEDEDEIDKLDQIEDNFDFDETKGLYVPVESTVKKKTGKEKKQIESGKEQRTNPIESAGRQKRRQAEITKGPTQTQKENKYIKVLINDIENIVIEFDKLALSRAGAPLPKIKPPSKPFHSLLPDLNIQLRQNIQNLDMKLVKSQKDYYPRSHLTFKEFFTDLPKCSICNVHGIICSGSKVPKSSEIWDMKGQEQLELNAHALGYSLLKCKLCKMKVHSECYGILGSAKEEEWKCDICIGNPTLTGVSCAICTKAYRENEPEAFAVLEGDKESKEGEKKYCHIFCGIWTKGVYMLASPRQLHFPLSPQGKWEPSCSLCNNIMGYCCQCMWEGCTKTYHPYCARNAAYLFNLFDYGGKTSMTTFCDEHSKISMYKKINSRKGKYIQNLS